MKRPGLRRTAADAAGRVLTPSERHDAQGAPLPSRVRAKARRRRPLGEMNQTERAYAELLTRRMAANEVVEWYFERVKLRLADNTFYTPDFMVINSAHEVEFHEVKGGFVREDAIVKWKVAAEQNPWATLVMVQGQGSRSKGYTFRELRRS